MEPPSRVEFSNTSGGWIDCTASGSPPPTINWLSVDGSGVEDVLTVRRVLHNGTLVLLPFSAAAYRQDIHNTVYRCVASNTVGRIISRDVQVRAGKCKSEKGKSCKKKFRVFPENVKKKKKFFFELSFPLLKKSLDIFFKADARLRKRKFSAEFRHNEAEVGFLIFIITEQTCSTRISTRGFI